MTRPFTITIFGAESTGKTTLSRELARLLDGEWVYEFARPYLETTHQDVTPESMQAIWLGQAGLQRNARKSPRIYVVQDTDLFSTVGYWKLPHIQPVIGHCPQALINDAHSLRSDLYLIVQSNIPFESDVLRYGGNTRESTDEYWGDLCAQYSLPYVVLDASGRGDRINEASQYIKERILACVAL
ncbi:MAG: ATP-binding protein [Candidatus Saccharimonas sp.]